MFVWIVVCLLVAVIVHRTVRYMKQRRNEKYVFNTIPPNTVCLFQVGRGPVTPSLSPFPLKLETYLRMAKIPYMNDHSGMFSSKGKVPWIMYNKMRIEDSQLSIDFLKKEFPDPDVNKGLTDQEHGIARAIKALTEDNLYWTMCHESFVKNTKSLDVLLMPIYPWWKVFMFKVVVGWKVKGQVWSQGVGRHADADIWGIAQKDLTALSSILGNKPFFLGDKPREIDCTVFGMLSMVRWQMSTTRHERFFLDELKNLVQFCDRMKNRFWPDWEKRCKGSNYENDHRKLQTNHII